MCTFRRLHSVVLWLLLYSDMLHSSPPLCCHRPQFLLWMITESLKLVIIENRRSTSFMDIIHSPTAVSIGVDLVMVCFLRRSAILTAIAETNPVTMTTVTTMTAMVMTMLSGSVAELCCTVI